MCFSIAMIETQSIVVFKILKLTVVFSQQGLVQLSSDCVWFLLVSCMHITLRFSYFYVVREIIQHIFWHGNINLTLTFSRMMWSRPLKLCMMMSITTIRLAGFIPVFVTVPHFLGYRSVHRSYIFPPSYECESNWAFAVLDSRFVFGFACTCQSYGNEVRKVTASSCCPSGKKSCALAWPKVDELVVCQFFSVAEWHVVHIVYYYKGDNYGKTILLR